MKIKKNCKASTSDFWYDLTDGGYLDPAKICVDRLDVVAIRCAVEVLKDFYQSCEEQIEGFVQ